MNKESGQLEQVNLAFGKQSAEYDNYDRNNTILTWMRSRVRTHVLSLLEPGSSILEINGGSGLDAVFFAKKGHFIVTTDLSEMMVSEMQKKIEDENLADRVTAKQLSYTELNKISNQKFDLIFSNFGGLNCVSDLNSVTSHFPSLLKKGGRICLVIMPPVCPGEIVQVFRGNSALAFRRFKKNGAESYVEGIKFKTYYFGLGSIITSLEERFEKISSIGLGVFTPIPQMERFQLQFPRILNLLIRLDNLLSSIFPFNRMGDHIIVSAKFKG